MLRAASWQGPPSSVSLPVSLLARVSSEMGDLALLMDILRVSVICDPLPCWVLVPWDLFFPLLLLCFDDVLVVHPAQTP